MNDITWIRFNDISLTFLISSLYLVYVVCSFSELYIIYLSWKELMWGFCKDVQLLTIQKNVKGTVLLYKTKMSLDFACNFLFSLSRNNCLFSRCNSKITLPIFSKGKFLREGEFLSSHVSCWPPHTNSSWQEVNQLRQSAHGLTFG